MSAAGDANARRDETRRAARAGVAGTLRAVIPVEKDLPDPLAEALRRAEAAIEQVRPVSAEDPPVLHLDA